MFLINSQTVISYHDGVHKAVNESSKFKIVACKVLVYKISSASKIQVQWHHTLAQEYHKLCGARVVPQRSVKY